MALAYQLPGGGGLVPDLNLPPPEGGEQAPPLAAEVDRISSLPKEARQRVLSFLPLKTATMLGMVSRSWSRFVSKPQWPCDCILGIHVRPATQGPCDDCLATTHVASDQIAPLLANELVVRRGRGPGHRLLRFFLKVEDTQTRPADFDSLLNYSAACDVEHVRVVVVDVRPGPPELSFNFSRASHHLLRLSLFGVGVNEAQRPLIQFRSIDTLEVLTIQTTSLDNLDLRRILVSCKRLRILILRNCRDLTCVNVTAANERLARLTVVECPQVDTISASTALGLRSFSYSGGFLRSVALPQTCFADLRICFTKVILVDRIRYHNWLDALPNLSNLVNLTICSNALTIISDLRSRGNFQVAKFCNLHNLRELHLGLYRMNTVMLSQIYEFLRMCRCSRLRNLFVELPKPITDPFVFVAAAVNELAEEPTMDGFESLVKVKITNFKWQGNEIELVHFLFRKARSLQKLILVVPKGTNHPDTGLLGNALPPELYLLRLQTAPANVDVQVLTQ